MPVCLLFKRQLYGMIVDTLRKARTQKTFLYCKQCDFH